MQSAGMIPLFTNNPKMFERFKVFDKTKVTNLKTGPNVSEKLPDILRDFEIRKDVFTLKRNCRANFITLGKITRTEVCTNNILLLDHTILKNEGHS